ncbi:MAG: AAA family ATPase [Lachnospiraceae bacterium]|nr:AAA family ATPase [Lachnospiraceae bacterium]
MEQIREMSFITKSHGDNLPTVRIKKVILDNFKSVGHGEITFNCGREFVPFNTESDILGIYGQNGSGKTSFIEALSILKGLMSGVPVPSVYADCVSVGKESAKLEFVFDLQYNGGIIREADYSFCMSSKPLTKEEIDEKYKDAPEKINIPEEDYKVVIFDEKFSLLWEDASKRQIIIDTSTEETPFNPTTKRKEIAGGGKKVLVALEVNKQLARSKSRSFIFMSDTLKKFSENNDDSVYFKVLVELRYFARHYLYVIDTKSSGFIRLNFALPIYTTEGQMMFSAKRPEVVPAEAVPDIKNDLENISSVLEQLVPGLSIGFKEISQTLDKDGEAASVIMLMAYRDGKELPLRDESDGVRKIISVLSLIIAAFNQQSVTVAIDEFDAGIFEYLLGEILQALEEAGRGQFIFTSHNLRPLEVIDKKFLYFTTTNAENRYIRLKNISATNNLRDTYFREIVLCEQEEKIYNKTKRFKIIAALKKAGEER